MFVENETVLFLESVLDDIRSGRKKMIFFGAGRYARTFMENYCNKKKIPLPAYICDNNQALWGTKACGVEVVNPKMLDDEQVEDSIIVISVVQVFSVLHELQSTFEEKGLQKYYHFMLPLGQLEAYLYCTENAKRIEHVYQKLGDEKSRFGYRKYFQFLLEGTPICSTIFTPNPYWDNDLIGRLKRGWGVAYAGAYDGKHLDRALRSEPDIELYGFEPNKSFALKLKEKYYNKRNVHIFGVGLGKEAEKSSFDNTDGWAAMRVDSNGRTGRSIDTIDVDTLDHLIPGKIDLIALDIEGDEVNAICGAERIIREKAPILAICVYHRIEHYVEVVEQIERINPSYTFFFRQHSVGSHESVVYAISHRDYV